MSGKWGWRALRISAGVGGALLIGTLAFNVYQAGELQDIVPRGIEGCRRLPGVVGGEDLHLDAAAAPHRAPTGGGGGDGLAADDRRAAAAGRPGVAAIYRLDAGAAVAEDVTPRLGFNFHPHGLGYVRLAAPSPGPDGAAVTASLAVINHRKGGVFDSSDDSVEIFSVLDDATLRHRRSVQDPLLRPMNDVALVDEDRFYASLDHRFKGGPLRVAEDLLRLPLSGVAYFDGRVARQVADGIRYANGVAASADGATLYLTGTVDRAVFAYDRDLATGDLKLRQRLDIGTGIDNLTVDADGALWTGAHPKLLTFLRHAADAAVPSPSQVVRIHNGLAGFDVVLADDGRLFSGAAAAAEARLADGSRRLLVGPVFAEHLLDCHRPTPGR